MRWLVWLHVQPAEPHPERSLRRPTSAGLAKEVRTAFVFPRLALSIPRLALYRREGSGPVMVLPGFGTTDASTVVLRRFVRYLGYDVSGWGLGVNNGNVPALLPEVEAQVERIAGETGHPLQLVGWSLGGVLARELARDRPDLVRSVISLGSPVFGGPKYTVTASLYERRGFDLDAIEAQVLERYDSPIAVPVTSVYSRGDGVVGWEACIDTRTPGAKNIEVRESHLGLGLSPRVLGLVAEHLREHQPSS